MSKFGNGSKKHEKRSFNPIAFAIVIVSLTTLVVMFVPSLRPVSTKIMLFFEGLGNPITSIPIKAPTLTRTPTPTMTSTPTPAPTSTATPTPTWDIVIPLPTEFYVGPWHEEPLECYVRIIGVEIFGGTPPYTIKFTQDNQVDFRTSPINGRVKFVNPVIVKKSETVYVSISYKNNIREIQWEDELYYPQDISNLNCIP